MARPERVQMTRQRPWRREHPDAVIVARPSRWGNPWRVRRVESVPPWQVDAGSGVVGQYGSRTVATQRAVDLFRRCLEQVLADHPDYLAPLAGRDLACWCPLQDADGAPAPCHADVLLELANPPPATSDDTALHHAPQPQPPSISTRAEEHP